MLYVVVEPNSEVMFSLPGFDADGDKVCGVWGMEVQPVVDFVTTPCCPCWCPMDEPLHPIPWHCSNDNHGLAFVYLRLPEWSAVADSFANWHSPVAQFRHRCKRIPACQ